MKLTKIIKRIFCIHEWERDIVRDVCDKGTPYICVKCGKRVYSDFIPIEFFNRKNKLTI